MMLLCHVRDYISSLGIAEDEHCYSGKMPDKQPESIGIYPLKRNRDDAVGGEQNKTYGIKSVSLLVHWNKNQIQTEETAFLMQERLKSCRDCHIGEKVIKFINVHYDEPVSIGTDENGIYEYVIECDIYYEKG